jgi:hypothetical protein
MPRPSPWDLDFAASRSAAQKHLGRSLEILRPLVVFSHGLLRETPALCRDDADLSVALAFRQTLEFADAVDLLLRHMMITPAAAQARSALEHAPQVILLAMRKDPVLAAAYVMSGLRSAEHELERKLTAPGLDDEDRRRIQAELEEARKLYEGDPTDRTGKEAADEIRKLRPGRPWYSIRNGPENIHRLFEELSLGALSNFYSDLNPVVHGGMPVMAAATASGDPVDATSMEWIRPLRATSPWAFRPVLSTTMAVNLALMSFFVCFVPRAPGWIERMQEFGRMQEKRCKDTVVPPMTFL